MKNSFHSLKLLFFAYLLATSVQAEEQNSNDWQFEVTPYFLAAAMDGSVGMRGVTADIDLSFSDIWDNLDKAFLLMFTAQKGKWVFGFDGIYFKLAGKSASTWQGPLGSSNTAQLNVDITQQVYALFAARRVLDKRAKVDLLGQARYTNLDATVKLAVDFGSDLLPDGSRSTEREEGWWDAAIGTRVVLPITEGWDLLAYADIGAGGSDLTYQLMAGLNWQFSQTLTGKFGYRYFYQDYEKDDFKWDMTTSGVYAGLGIRF